MFHRICLVLSCLDVGQECMNGGQCVQRPLGDYICSCPYPYCGMRCENQRPSCTAGSSTGGSQQETTLSSGCSSSLCNNRGTCRQQAYGRGIQCYCAPGWSGTRCQYGELLFFYRFPLTISNRVCD